MGGRGTFDGAAGPLNPRLDRHAQAGRGAAAVELRAIGAASGAKVCALAADVRDAAALDAAFAQLRQTHGCLIYISAGMACMPHALQAHVGAAKAGIDMLMKNLAIEWGR